jgi:hypothetical protein
MAVANPHIRLRIKIYKRIVEDLVLQSTHDLAEVAFLTDGGVGNIAYNITRIYDVFEFGEVGIQLDNIGDRHGTFLGGAGIFANIRNTSYYYKCEILVDSSWVEKGGCAGDDILYVDGAFMMTYQILYAGYIAQESFVISEINKTAQFTIKPYLWWLSKWDYVLRSHNVNMVYPRIKDVFETPLLLTGVLDSVTINDVQTTNVYVPMVTTEGILDIAGAKVLALIPYDLTDGLPHRRYFLLQVESGGAIINYVGSPQNGWVEISTTGHSYEATYDVSPPIQPTAMGWTDLKTATATWLSVAFGGGHCCAPESLIGREGEGEVDGHSFPDYSLLTNALLWENFLTTHLRSDLGAPFDITNRCPVFCLFRDTERDDRGRIGVAQWTGSNYIFNFAFDPNRVFIRDISHRSVDFSTDRNYHVIFNNPDALNPQLFGREDSNMVLSYTHDGIGKNSKGQIIKQIYLKSYTATNQIYTCVIENNAGNETYWQTAELISNNKDVVVGAFDAHFIYGTFQNYKNHFEPKSDWNESNQYKAFRTKYKGEMVWGILLYKTDNGVTNAYIQLMDDNGNILEDILILPMVKGEVQICLHNNVGRHTWGICFAGVSTTDADRLITGEVRFISSPEYVNQYYRIPYVSDKDMATSLINTARSYGFSLWITPGNRMIARQRIGNLQSDRTDIPDLIQGKTFDGMVNDEAVSQIEIELGNKIKHSIGMGAPSLTLNAPYCTCKDLAIRQGANALDFYGYRRKVNISMKLFFTELLNTISLGGIYWFVLRQNHQIGLTVLATDLELLEASGDNLVQSPKLECLLSGLEYKRMGNIWGWGWTDLGKCLNTCPACDSQEDALTTKWLTMAAEFIASLDSSETDRGTLSRMLIDYLYIHYNEWRDLWQALVDCWGGMC